MNDKINKLKKIILANNDKKILILSSLENEINFIHNKLNMGEIYDSLFDNLLIENFGYIDTRYIPDREKNKIEETIAIKKGTPIFSRKIIACDIIIFLYVAPQTLKVLCAANRESYDNVLNLQNNLIKTLKSKGYRTITYKFYPDDNALEKIGRNVYICDSNDYFLTDKKILSDDYDINENYLRFPYIKKVAKIEHLKRKQGFLLIINEKYLEKKDYIDIDKKYRKLFNRFNLVYIVTNDLKKIKLFHIKFTNTYFVQNDYFDDDELMELYYNYILSLKKTRFSKNKVETLKKINQYLKGKDIVTTSELTKVFAFSPRNVERYMHDYNIVYQNIGYDYRKNEWYIIH